jgi:quercetin dioxygenase-like cupin family protein
MATTSNPQRAVVLILAGLVAISCGTMAGAHEDETLAAPADGPRVLAAEDINWVEDPQLPGVRSAVLWGDPNSGKEHALLRRFPAGYAPPPHSHPSTESVVMIAGHIVVEHEGGERRVLGPGSYSQIPANMVHAVRCTTEAECIFLLRSPGLFTIKFAEGRPGAKN